MKLNITETLILKLNNKRSGGFTYFLNIGNKFRTNFIVLYLKRCLKNFNSKNKRKTAKLTRFGVFEYSLGGIANPITVSCHL